MKRSGLLHPELSAIVAALGHGETLCVGDSGLPVPPGTPIIALGYRAGQPPFLDVIDAVIDELVVEAAIVAEELTDGEIRRGLMECLGSVTVSTVDHEALKARLADCRAVVRTGEQTPFANVILVAGVAF